MENKEIISKNIIESYIFSTVRHDFGIYSERLLLRLVELAQCEINGLDFKGGNDLGKVTIGEWGHAEIVIPIKDILSGEDDKNYTRAKAAIRGLMGKFLEFEDNNRYKATQILNEVDMEKISGKMIIQVNRNIWNAMLDFSKGFRKYELDTAAKLRGKYSLRIYKLISNQSSPMTYSIDELRKMWGVINKYKKDSDFIRNTIQVAKIELDKISPYTFDYKLNYTKNPQNAPRRGRPTLSSITFIPLHCLQKETTDSIRKMTDTSLLLKKDITSLLINKFGFDWQGIKANISLFDIAQKNLDLFDFLQSIAPKALRVVNPKGYVINALKKCLKEDFGIILTDGVIIHNSNIIKKAPVIQKEPISITDIFGDLMK